jgi:hypothetical protein
MKYVNGRLQRLPLVEERVWTLASVAPRLVEA